MVDLTRNMLSPENIILIQVPPIRNQPKNEHINERIKLFNDKVNALAGDENYKVANVYDLMKTSQAMIVCIMMICISITNKVFLF